MTKTSAELQGYSHQKLSQRKNDVKNVISLIFWRKNSSVCADYVTCNQWKQKSAKNVVAFSMLFCQHKKHARTVKKMVWRRMNSKKKDACDVGIWRKLMKEGTARFVGAWLKGYD